MAIKNNIKHQIITTSSNYKGLPINASTDKPSYEAIIDKSYRELTSLIAIHSRTVLVRLDLHASIDCDPMSISMKEFCRSFQRKLKNKYKSEVAYQWVLESGRNKYNKGFHWHIWVAVKNHHEYRPKRQSNEMYRIILESWVKYAKGINNRNHQGGWFFIERNKLKSSERALQQIAISEGGDGVLMNINVISERKNNNRIVLGGVIDECFYTLSYLAKVFSKVRTPHTKGNHLFASSNLRRKKFAESRQKEIDDNLETIHMWLQNGLSAIPLKIRLDLNPSV